MQLDLLQYITTRVCANVEFMLLCIFAECCVSKRDSICEHRCTNCMYIMGVHNTPVYCICVHMEHYYPLFLSTQKESDSQLHTNETIQSFFLSTSHYLPLPFESGQSLSTTSGSTYLLLCSFQATYSCQGAEFS